MSLAPPSPTCLSQSHGTWCPCGTLVHLSELSVDLGSHNPPAPLQVLLQGPYWPHGTTLPIIVNVLERDHEAELKLQNSKHVLLLIESLCFEIICYITINNMFLRFQSFPNQVGGAGGGNAQCLATRPDSTISSGCGLGESLAASFLVSLLVVG